MNPKEIAFETRFGQITGLQWGQGNKQQIVAFHGWLDNAASFSHLAPFLAEAGYEVNAIDFPGHGHSDHRAPGHNYGFVDYVIDIQAVMENFKQPVIFLCHSMGAAIGQLYAAAYPEHVSHLVLIENVGPIPAYVKGTAAKSLREALDIWKPHSLVHKRCYSSVDDAVKARLQATPMDGEIIRPLVRRGLKKSEEGYHWRTDKRLKLRSFFRMSEEQVQDYLSSTQMPCQLIMAEPKSYALNYASVEDRIAALNPQVISAMPGCHHLHMTQAKTIAKEILAFIDHYSHPEQNDKPEPKQHPRPFHPF
ncbi:alpha/beta hydrolase [Marinicella rhabdoformis]|uniref:alpha/beta hydrolase n=1 Tax=Marinicella rhabdoformis TaxID=2580566 RepID=UPI0015D0CAE2|nr:alpha/beta hydrolase [Marinicella rhabdoformis]